MIVICDRCKGAGQVEQNHGSHNSDWRTEICTTCEGSGRLVMEVSTNYEPFKPGEDSERLF